MSVDEFGDRVRQLREERDLTQSVLADLTGRTRSSITNIETGRQQPSVPALVALSRALGVSVGVLLGEEQVPPLPRTARVVIDVIYRVRCSICGVVGRWQDQAEAEHARKEHGIRPHADGEQPPTPETEEPNV